MIQLEVLLQEPGTASGGRADEHGPGRREEPKPLPRPGAG